MNRKTRKILTSNGLFHPQANLAGLHLKKCEGGGLTSTKDCVLSECKELWDCLQKLEPFLKEVVKDFMVEKEEKNDYDRSTKKGNDTNLKEKSLPGKFPKSIADFVDSVS